VRVIGLDHLVLRATDVERTLAWYRDRLGLAGERVEEWRRGEAPFPSVRIDDRTLIDILAGAPSGTNVDHLCLVVDGDLDAIAASGDFEVVGAGPVDGLFGAQGFARSLYVRDPDGTVVELRAYPAARTGRHPATATVTGDDG
jgi:catechol 2,3-dioxygenase-like lactoylglutathione lyase family enzyme